MRNWYLLSESNTLRGGPLDPRRKEGGERREEKGKREERGAGGELDIMDTMIKDKARGWDCEMCASRSGMILGVCVEI